jgi:chromosome segregation protein
VADGAAYALARLAGSLAEASEQRQTAEQASKGRAVALKEVRIQVRELAAEFDRVVDAAHGTEMARAQHRMRLEQLAARAAEEFAVSAEELVAEYGPTVPVPVISPDSPASSPSPAAERPADAGRADDAGLAGDPLAGDPVDGPLAAQEAPDRAGHPGLVPPPSIVTGPPSEEQQVLTGTIPYVRAEQERRAAAAQRQLDQLGKVNPLALEEFAALEERHAFLATQLEDLKKTRRDLLTVVKEVDDRVQEVFASAFEDTAREFEGIFSQLFPGGEGRLILTEPDDMLATGIDFEARPPGKKVKRMSLLSGGERSLTAIAFLLAIFKARPSPFYVLDEVEAALDDTNMQRLLHIFEELRSASQLLIITHQKRTMEIADALYGISMRGDGVSAVVSQRLRERESA